MSKYYRIYCITEEGPQYEWSDTALTVCPNDAGHTINPNSINIMKEESIAENLSPNSKVISSIYEKIFAKQYLTSKHGKIRRCKIIARKDSDATSYDIQLFDLTNLNVLLTSTGHTNTSETFIDLGVITSPPSGDFILEFSVRKNGSSGNIYIDNIIIFSE